MTTAQALTLDEFLKLPERKPALEFWDGQVTRKVSPKARHSRLQVTLATRINAFSEPIRIAMAFAELRATFAGDSVVPDVSVLRWERLPRTADGELLDDLFEPPAIAMEVVSPRQSVAKLVQRCIWYVEHGVRIALLVDPRDRLVLSFRPERAPLALRGPDRIDLDEVLAGFQLTVDELFASLHVG